MRVSPDGCGTWLEQALLEAGLRLSAIRNWADVIDAIAERGLRSTGFQGPQTR